MAFGDLNQACKGLLITTVNVLAASGLKYVVAGGWVPILGEKSHPALIHPGTRDVDVLMIDDLKAVQAAAQALLDAGFRPSAKHEFQLLKDARVGSHDFVFNIDLMHPYEESSTPQMFNDIFDLGVRDNYDPRESRYAKSIAFESAAIVYEQKLFENVTLQDLDLDNVLRTVTVPILSPAAAILSKCASVKIKKRTRDAFDIYYILSGHNGIAHAETLKALSGQFQQVAEQLSILIDFLQRSPDIYNDNVARHAGKKIPTAASESLALLI